jgi:uncharacterized protein (TIGR03437 family)
MTRIVLLFSLALRLAAQSCTLTAAAGRTANAPAFPVAAARFTPNTNTPMAVLADGTLVFSWQDFVVRMDGPVLNAWSPAQQPPTGSSSYASIAALLPDANGNLIAASRQNTVRLLRPDGTSETLAGAGTDGFAGDGGPGAKALLKAPQALAWMPDGSLLIADTGNYRIRRLAPDGSIGTFAGLGGGDATIGNEGPATRARIGPPTSIAVAEDGSVFFFQDGRILRKITPDGIIHILGGDQAKWKPQEDNVPLAEAAFEEDSRLAFTPDRRLLVVDRLTVRVLGGDGRLHVLASLPAEGYYSRQIAVAPDGGLYYTHNSSIVRLDPGGSSAAVVSNNPKRSADGAPALTAPLGIMGLGIGPEGDPYLVDQFGPTMYRLRPDGILEKTALQPKDDPYPFVRLVFDAQGRMVYWRAGAFYRVERDGMVTLLAGGGKDTDPRYEGPGTGMEAYFSGGRFALAPDGSIYAGELRRGAVYRIAPDGVASVYWRPTQGGISENAGVLLSRDGSMLLMSGQLLRLQPPSDSQVLVPASINRSLLDFFEDGGIYFLTSQTFEYTAGLRRWSGSDLADLAAPFPRGQSGNTGFRNLLIPDAAGNAWVVSSYEGQLFRLSDYRACSAAVTPELNPVYSGDNSSVAAPGQPVTLSGINLGPMEKAVAQAEGGMIATSLAGMSVTVAGVPAPILSAQWNAIRFQVPYGLDLAALSGPGAYQARAETVVSSRGVSSAPISLYLVATNPRPLGMPANWDYYGFNTPTLRNAAGSLVTGANPVPRGGLFSVQFYGAGELDPARATGEMPAIPVRRAAGAVAAHYNGRYLETTWAGEVPGQPGLYQVNMVVPADLPPGMLRIVLLVGAGSATFDVPVN